MNKILIMENRANEIKAIPPITLAPAIDSRPLGRSFLKKWIKKVPYFPAIDYLRRRIYDSPLFDSSVRPLAQTLEEWPGALLIDITNRCNAKCVWCPNPDLTNVGAMDMSCLLYTSPSPRD